MAGYNLPDDVSQSFFNRYWDEQLNVEPEDDEDNFSWDDYAEDIMRHHAAITIVQDLPDGTGLRIIERCHECDVTVSEYVIDVSAMSEEESILFFDRLLGEDSEQWMLHTRTPQGSA